MKTIGFTLHAMPMNLWYAGIVVAMLLTVVGGEQGRRFSARLMRQMPVIIALGINFGIVPLLFIQVGFGSVFYPATILMAWPWLLVVVLLLPAYYGVYVYSYALTKPSSRWSWFPRTAGWGAASRGVGASTRASRARLSTAMSAGRPLAVFPSAGRRLHLGRRRVRIDGALAGAPGASGPKGHAVEDVAR